MNDPSDLLGRVVVARPGRDCATRVRIRYELPVPLVADDAALLPGAEVIITEFSLFVDGALDHLRLRLGSELEIAGALGGSTIEATYGRFGGRHPTRLVQEVEARIAHRWGPIVHAGLGTR